MWDKIKRVFHFIMTILLYSVFAILIIVAIMVGLYFIDHYQSVKSGTNRAPLFGAYVIISPSMVPNINVLDAVVTMRTDADKLKKNDVITFVSQDPRHSGITVTHRIVGIKKTESGGYAYRTKGDNNNVEDQTLVSYDKVIGKVMLRIPYIGYLQQLLNTQFGWIVVIVIPCLFIISSDIVKLIKRMVLGEDSETSKKKYKNSDYAKDLQKKKKKLADEQTSIGLDKRHYQERNLEEEEQRVQVRKVMKSNGYEMGTITEDDLTFEEEMDDDENYF